MTVIPFKRPEPSRRVRLFKGLIDLDAPLEEGCIVALAWRRADGAWEEIILVRYYGLTWPRRARAVRPREKPASAMTSS